MSPKRGASLGAASLRQRPFLDRIGDKKQTFIHKFGKTTDSVRPALYSLFAQNGFLQDCLAVAEKIDVGSAQDGGWYILHFRQILHRGQH